MDQTDEFQKIYGHDENKPIVHCTLFEDNYGTLELAHEPRYRPRTKHTEIKYHHFREHVKSGRIKISPIDTKEQIVEQFTKGLPTSLFEYLRFQLIGW